MNPKIGKRYHLQDVLWWTRPDEVLLEIAKIMDIDSANTQTPKWFQYRTRAAKNILNDMSNRAKNQLRDEADKMSAQGLPVDLQRK
jgi:hypothetical protein